MHLQVIIGPGVSTDALCCDTPQGLQHVALLHQVEHYSRAAGGSGLHQGNVQTDAQGEEDGFRLVLMYQRELVNLYRCVYDFM